MADKLLTHEGEFKSTNDWIYDVLMTASRLKTPAREAQERLVDESGKVTQVGLAAKDAVYEIVPSKLKTLLKRNGLTTPDPEAEFLGWKNQGMMRMNAGNKLRAAARNRGGLFIENTNDFVDAPSDFEVHEPLRQNPDGSKIKPVKEKEAA